MRRPLCVDLYAGLGGWSDGFIAEGWDCVGFDIERHRYLGRNIVDDGLADGIKTGDATNKHGSTIFNYANESKLRNSALTGQWAEYPGQLVLQDVLTLHGSQFKDAACIVASPPCQEYSYMAMPWSRGKQIARAIDEPECHRRFPEGYTGSRTIGKLNALFNACFRIQREASEAAGHHIPLIVENVKGAQPWVGKAKANYGSFYLWGDIASVGGRIVRPDRIAFGMAAVAAGGRMKQNPDGTAHGQGSWFAVADSKNRGAHAAQKVAGFNFHQHENGQPGGSFQSAAVKVGAKDFAGYGGGFGWDGSQMRQGNSKSSARKAASAQIAKIPLPLAQHIARIYYPDKAAEAC